MARGRPTSITGFGAGMAALALAACATPHPGGTVVDLTHAFGDRTIYWPGSAAFHWEKTSWGMTDGGYWYAAGRFAAAEHGGTHMDAPVHFARDRLTLEAIPVERLVGPGVVVDLRAECAADRDYAMSVQDVLAWEAEHGRIPAGALVFMQSGWSTRWPDAVSYLGSPDLETAQGLHFPGISPEAAEFLVTQRHVRGVGIDTASVDPGRSRDFPVHRILSEHDVYIMENVAALDRLPPKGATVVALPMKIQGGTGGPARIIAFVP